MSEENISRLRILVRYVAMFFASRGYYTNDLVEVLVPLGVSIFVEGYAEYSKWKKRREVEALKNDVAIAQVQASVAKEETQTLKRELQ